MTMNQTALSARTSDQVIKRLLLAYVVSIVTATVAVELFFIHVV